MATRIVAAAALAASLGLAGTGTAQEQAPPPVQIRELQSPRSLELMRAPAPTLAPDAAALRAKLVKAQADLVALSNQPAPSGLSPRDAAALQAQQAEDRRLADAIQEMTGKLDAGGSVGDVTEELQLRLQQLMERRQKAVDTQSNMLKKYSEMSQAIISNLK